jgi:hypothetical protein
VDRAATGRDVGIMGQQIASFFAVIPDIQSALKVSGEGAGRLTLDMDETQLPEVLKALAFGKEQLLIVTISTE